MPAYTSYSDEGTTRRQLAVAAGFLILAAALHFLPVERQQSVASVLRETVLRPFVAMQQSVSSLRTRAADPASLRRQLDSLVAITTSNSVLEEENRRLKRLLQLKVQLQAGLGGSWVTATVMRPGTQGSESMFLLDIGSEAGVKPYSPVITAQGLVGVVNEVAVGRAVGIDWTHPEFRASAMDPQGIAYGIVSARRGEFREEDRMEFNGIAFHGLVEDGTVVRTSGLGGTFPRGIAIGRVDGLAEAEFGWRKSYWLRPMVEPGSVTHVLVGVATDSTTDLSAFFPVDSILTESELAVADIARTDSLRAMGDSVAMLRLLITATMPLRDSLIAALLSGRMTVPPRAAAGVPSSGPVGGRAGGRAVGAAPPRAAGAPPPGAALPPVGTPIPAVPDTTVPRPDTTRTRSNP